MEDTAMEDAATEVAAEFWLGVEQFNQGQFYGCHDTLEAIWMEATEPQKTFYQGVLQISVALYHLSNQNWRGATILLGEGINRLRRYLPTYATVNVEALLEQSMKLLVALQQAQPEQVAEWAAELAEARWQDDRSSQTVSTSSNCQMTVPTIETVN